GHRDRGAQPHWHSHRRLQQRGDGLRAPRAGDGDREIRRAHRRRQLRQGGGRVERRRAPGGDAGRDRAGDRSRARHHRARRAVPARMHGQGRLRFLALCRRGEPRRAGMTRAGTSISFRLAGAAAVALVLALAAPAGAETVAEFYKGKTVTIVTSTGVGGTYDLVARMVARHMPRYLPGNPTMVVQNMPGGGNVLATNFMYNIAPKDGTTIATIHNAMPLHQVLDGRGVRYDAGKFNWLGSTGADNEVVFAWHTAGIRSVADAVRH